MRHTVKIVHWESPTGGPLHFSSLEKDKRIIEANDGRQAICDGVAKDTQVLRSSAKVGLAGKVALYIPSIVIVWFDHHVYWDKQILEYIPWKQTKRTAFSSTHSVTDVSYR